MRSRFADASDKEDFAPFVRCLQQLGFDHIRSDTSNKMFVTMLFKKRPGAGAAAAAAKKIKWPPLKACLYKRR